jgi:hypothetical protein
MRRSDPCSIVGLFTPETLREIEAGYIGPDRGMFSFEERAAGRNAVAEAALPMSSRPSFAWQALGEQAKLAARESGLVLHTKEARRTKRGGPFCVHSP